MDGAFDVLLQRDVRASQIFARDPDGVREYECLGCDVRVFPAAFRPEKPGMPGVKYSVRAYFQAKSGAKHADDCDVGEQRRILDEGRKKSVSQHGRFPCRFPSRLELRDPATRIRTGAAISDDEVCIFTNGKPRSHPSRQGAYVAPSLTAICGHYLNFPFDRHLPLAVPDVHGRTYEEVFWSLSNSAIRVYRKHILYGRLQWKSEPRPEEDFLELVLNHGDRDGAVITRPYRLRLLWRAWTQSRRDKTLHAIQTARREARASYIAQTKEHAWLFFLGDQDANDPSILSVADPRLFCCIVDVLVSSPKQR